MANDRNVVRVPRFVLDENFVGDLFKDISKAQEYMSKLSDIHRYANSPEYPSWEHNQMPDRSFKAAISNKSLRAAGIHMAGVLLGAAHPVARWEADGLHATILKMSIALAANSPFEVVVLTSAEQQKTYATNPHYEDKGVRSAVAIKSGAAALAAIDAAHATLFKK